MHTGKTTIKEATVTMVLIWIVAEVEVHTVEVDEDTEDVVEVVVAWEAAMLYLAVITVGFESTSIESVGAQVAASTRIIKRVMMLVSQETTEKLLGVLYKYGR